MGDCGLCGREQNTADGCVEHEVVFADGERMKAREHRGGYEEVCPDCGASPGNYHHPGCDWAKCPRCNEQLLKHEDSPSYPARGCEELVKHVSLVDDAEKHR